MKNAVVTLVNDIIHEGVEDGFPAGTKATLIEVDFNDINFPFKIQIGQYKFWVSSNDIEFKKREE